jgi:hypothetical protein
MHQLLFMNFQWKILHMDYIQQESIHIDKESLLIVLP